MNRHVSALFLVATVLLGQYSEATIFPVPADTTVVTPVTFWGFAYGDTFEIDAGPRGQILFRNFRGEGHPTTVVRNSSSGIVRIDAMNNEYGIKLQNCQNVRLTGSAYPGAEYGLVVYSSGNEAGVHCKGVWAEQGVSSITVDHVEVDGVNEIDVGIAVKTEPNAAAGHVRNLFTQENTEIYNNYVHDVLLEGFYMALP